MRKVVLSFVLLTCAPSLYSQPLNVPEKSFIAPFDIVQADGKHFRAADLVHGKPVMIIYFDPDCDHCTEFISELLKNANLFSDTQIVLVTYVAPKALRKYVAESGLANYPQIRAGTEGNKFIVRYHYNVMQFPFIALHNKSGKLFAKYEADVPSPLELSKIIKGH